MVEEIKEEKKEYISISPPNLQKINVVLRGTSPLVINHFGARKLGEVLEGMRNPSPAKKPKRKPKDLESDYEDALYRSSEGWYGMNASAVRNACISACKVAGYVMTKAKLSIFVLLEGLDVDHGTPLLQIHGKPTMYVANVRNESGVIDIRARPMWTSWEIRPTMEYDADQFKIEDVYNLLLRAGRQVGLGEGRHDSRRSPGIGFGCFEVASMEGRQ